MTEGSASGLRYRRAIVAFVLAYVVITVLAVALAIGLETAMKPQPVPNMVFSPSYLLAEKFYPVLNLLVWVPFAWFYFRGRDISERTFREARALGLVWLGLALVVDYVGFVAIQNPYSLSAHDFYVSQFPWIYLIYVVVLASPTLYVAFQSRGDRALAEG